MKLARRPWLLVFFVALTARLPLWLNLAQHPEALLNPDSSSYIMPAKNLLSQGVYSTSENSPYLPDAERPPGYPLFLAAHFLILDNIIWPSATQIVIDAGTAAMVSIAASCLNPHPAAWMVGLLYALDPVACAHAPLLLSEVVFTFFLTLSLLLLLRAGEEPRDPTPIALSGLCLGGATLTRPISVYLWLPWSLALAWAWPHRFKRQACLFAATALLLPAFWCARNWTNWRSFSFNPVRVADAMFWQAAAIQASIEGISMDDSRAKLANEFRQLYPKPSENSVEESRLLHAFARKIVVTHPMQAIKLYPISVLKMLLSPGLDLIAKAIWPNQSVPNKQSLVNKVMGLGTLAILEQRPLLWIVGGWVCLLLGLNYGLAALGFWRLYMGRQRFVLAACLVPIVFLVMVSSGGWVYYRHRIPILPLLEVLAAASGIRALGLRR